MKKVKTNIKPVKIDFPLPEQVTGIDKRLNTKNTFSLPEQYTNKHYPEYLVGKSVRLQYLITNP